MFTLHAPSLKPSLLRSRSQQVILPNLTSRFIIITVVSLLISNFHIQPTGPVHIQAPPTINVSQVLNPSYHEPLSSIQSKASTQVTWLLTSNQNPVLLCNNHHLSDINYCKSPRLPDSSENLAMFSSPEQGTAEFEQCLRKTMECIAQVKGQYNKSKRARR